METQQPLCGCEITPCHHDIEWKEQMADIGQATMDAIRAHAYPGWSPAQCPSEIVGDLRNECDELRAKLDGDTKVVAALIRVARAAWYAADDSEEVLTDYGRAHRIIGPDFDALSDALDALDELPDEQIAHLSLTDLLEKENVQLEAALKVARDGIDEFLVANDPTEFGCACDLSVGYLCGPCHADKQQQPLKSALAKINEVLKP